AEAIAIDGEDERRRRPHLDERDTGPRGAHFEHGRETRRELPDVRRFPTDSLERVGERAVALEEVLDPVDLACRDAEALSRAFVARLEHHLDDGLDRG